MEEHIEYSKIGYLDLPFFMPLIFNIFFILNIVVMNLFLIIAIIQEQKIRRRLFFKLILLIAVTHFLQGILVALSVGKCTHDPDACHLWHLTDLALKFVLGILFLMVLLERFFSLVYPQIVTRRSFRFRMLLSPWFVAVILAVILHYALPSDSVQIDVNHHDQTVIKTCRLGDYVRGMYSLFGFLIPSFFVLGFSWANIVILCFLKETNVEEPSEENPRRQTITSSAVAFCFVVMWLPSSSTIMLPAEVSFYSDTVFTVYLGFANATLTPILWLILPAIKTGYYRLCRYFCNVCRKAKHNTSVTSAVDENQTQNLGNEEIELQLLQNTDM